MSVYSIKQIQELARKDASSYDFPLLRFELGSEAQCIYDQAFEQEKEAATCS